ncbi:MAG: PD40 domain-containing protein [Candidatus Zixiibacteriota bacterium]|nr:MAG: PD40 domain-containing protein [candidate division Zixibacteria bacterium]
MTIRSILLLVSALNILPSDAASQLVLGQTPPGDEPELFHPEIFKDGTHSAPAFTPDGTEMYWSRYYTPQGRRSRTQHIFHSQFSDGQWSAPELASFSGTYSDGGPFLTKDGIRLFFYSNRPYEPGGEPLDEYGPSDIWYVDKTDDGWGEPQRLPFNTGQHEGMASVADDGTIFFQSNRSGTRGIFDTYFSELIEGAYAEPKNLDPGINCPGINFSPFIAPDQSFLIIAYNHNAPDNGLHITFKKPDGGWTRPVNMGEKINVTSAQRFPGLSPDGKYFFFTRGGAGSGLYWVEAGVIEDLKRVAFNR